MGTTQSRKQNNNLCFFLPPLSNNGPHSKDAIGSPEPDTPVAVRKRRKDVDEDDMARFSVSDFGLEKEGGGSSSADLPVTLTPPPAPGHGQIHEGPDCERLLQQQYELREVLGVGSSSTVHRCVSRLTGESFACKVIDCQQMDERFQGMMNQFLSEIDALRHLSHPGIIQLYDVYITPGDKIFIIMELLEGGELFDYVVQRGTLTEEEAAAIVKEITGALCYIHSKGIVHRDLKPENLLLTRKPKDGEPIVVKIIDFGLSKAMEEPVASTFLGTRGYLAPEMLQRQVYTKAVDSWALGVIVFVLLCGCLPFDDDSNAAPSEALLQKRFVLRFPRWAKNVSPSARDLLGHLLDLNPRTRYTAEQALDHPWVRGHTAPKGVLLASPGRIRKSPAAIKAVQAQQANRKFAVDPKNVVPGANVVQRKNSI